MTATVGRRQARRTALFLLYQWDLTGQPLTTLYEGTPDAFAVELAEAVSARAAELDARITEAAEGWTADRLGTLERNILRIAIHELDGESVPPEVAINEAVVLAKRYASEDAARLVNGILGRVARETETEVGRGRAEKRNRSGARTGRGAARAAEDDARGARAPGRRRERGGGGRGAHGARGTRKAGRDRAREGARSRGSTLAAGCTVLTSCARSSRAFSTSSS